MAELALGRFVSGSARLVWSLFILLQLVIGVVLAAQLTGRGLPALTESAPRSSLPFWVVTLGWIPFSVGLTLTFNAPMSALPWITALVLGTFLLPRGADPIAGELFSTLIAAIALGAVATVLSRSPKRPARLLLFIGGFFVLTVGALGLRGLAALIAGNSDAGARDRLNLVILVPTVSLRLTLGYMIVPHWLGGGARRHPRGAEVRST